MKIAIIGGGWVGCHLAYKLKNEHTVTIFEKNHSLFEETSYKNQNRLHLGFHYARNNKTRKLCLDTFDRFLTDYEFLTKELQHNLYCVTKNTSILDYETYLQIFKEFDYKEISNSLKNVEGCINTKERHINFDEAKKFFNEELSDLVVKKRITPSRLSSIKKEYDLVINATNNVIKDHHNHSSFFELTISLVYENIRKRICKRKCERHGPWSAAAPFRSAPVPPPAAAAAAAAAPVI
jgi:glutaredoxin-related protein